MKIVFLIVIVFTLVTIQQIQKGQKCKCTELLVDTDCNRAPECSWDIYNLKCNYKQKTQDNLINLDPQIPEKLSSNTHSFFCQEFNQTDCPKQNTCAWVDNQCTHFTGCTAFPKSFTEDCQNISTRCISDGFKCVEIGECKSYKTLTSCHYQNCFWNKRTLKCEDIDSCDKLPVTLDSDKECRDIIKECTVKEGGGCVLSGYHCQDQIYEQSCVTNRLGDMQCLWVDGKCTDKICDNAPLSIITDWECQNIQHICTTKLGGGCIRRGTCAQATNEAACIIDHLGKDCFWTGLQCTDRICENAPSSYNTNKLCQTILSKCITDGKGCITNYACSSASIKEACEMDPDGNECFYKGNYCSLKTCEDAQLIGDQQCTAYMSKCTGRKDDQPGCVYKTCDTAPLSINTNEQCEQYLMKSQCIPKQGGGCKRKSNCFVIDLEIACNKDIAGNQCYWDDIQDKCIQLGLCQQITNQKNCTHDFEGQQCEWVVQGTHSFCSVKSCYSAPKTLITEQQCQEYFQPSNLQQCTTTKGGGCVIKSKCYNASNEPSCTTDERGNKCFWNSRNSICRLLECDDIQGKSHLECNNVMKKCTIGVGGKCQESIECNSIENQQNCVYGTDGPCIWITDYPNDQGSKGFCFKYDSCQTFYWSTDSMCKMISPNCTTNGEKCVPITDCAHTNTNGGCVTGTDGMCVQTVKSARSTEPEVCRKFFGCSSAYYITHLQCQQANPRCTTDGIFGCIELTQCQQYIKEACHFNDAGNVKNRFGQTVSTGKCIWNEIKDTCQDESCSDFVFTTPQLCSTKLSLCTSDGQKCISKTPCDTYSAQEQCETGGSDGPCLWQNQCRRKTCSDIVDHTFCSEVDNCITDGRKCIQVSTCANYETQIACQSNGTDGICVWSLQGKCSLMNNCASASNDQLACNKADDRCKWITPTSYTPSKCIDHTCESYQAKVGYCQYFFNWDQSGYVLCKNQEGRCVQVELSSLSEEDCYPLTVYQYAWNPISNKCFKCDKTSNAKINATQVEVTTVSNGLGYLASLIVSILTF